MDINNYSYAPTMATDTDYVAQFENDDMFAEITKGGYFRKEKYYLYAGSYDGSFEVSEVFEKKRNAKRLYDFIVTNYATTPPTEELDIFIRKMIALENTF